MVMGLVGNIFRLISCMSSISRHVFFSNGVGRGGFDPEGNFVSISGCRNFFYIVGWRKKLFSCRRKIFLWINFKKVTIILEMTRSTDYQTTSNNLTSDIKLIIKVQAISWRECQRPVVYKGCVGFESNCERKSQWKE